MSTILVIPIILLVYFYGPQHGYLKVNDNIDNTQNSTSTNINQTENIPTLEPLKIKVLETKPDGAKLIKVLKDKQGNLLGKLYVYNLRSETNIKIKDRDFNNLVSSMYVETINGHKKSILYKVDRSGLRGIGGNEGAMNVDGFYAFQLVAINDENFEFYLLNDNGNGISDIINIYWDEYNKKFRLFGLDIERISSYINYNMNFGFSTDNNLYEVNSGDYVKISTSTDPIFYSDKKCAESYNDNCYALKVEKFEFKNNEESEMQKNSTKVKVDNYSNFTFYQSNQKSNSKLSTTYYAINSKNDLYYKILTNATTTKLMEDSIIMSFGNIK